MSSETRRLRQIRRWTDNPEILSRRFYRGLAQNQRVLKGWLYTNEYPWCPAAYHEVARRVLLHKGRKP